MGGDGIIAVLPKPLSDEEERLLIESARTLRQALDDLATAGEM